MWRTRLIMKNAIKYCQSNIYICENMERAASAREHIVVHFQGTLCIFLHTISFLLAHFIPFSLSLLATTSMLCVHEKYKLQNSLFFFTVLPPSSLHFFQPSCARRKKQQIRAASCCAQHLGLTFLHPSCTQSDGYTPPCYVWQGEWKKIEQTLLATVCRLKKLGKQPSSCVYSKKGKKELHRNIHNRLCVHIYIFRWRFFRSRGWNIYYLTWLKRDVYRASTKVIEYMSSINLYRGQKLPKKNIFI